MKSKVVNLEHTILRSLDEPDISNEDLEKISDAWSESGYRIWFELDIDLWGNPYIEISACRSIKHDGVDMTRRWMEVRKHLEQGDIPDWLVETALKH